MEEWPDNSDEYEEVNLGQLAVFEKAGKEQ